MIRSSLRTKILLSVGLIIFAVLGTTTFFHIRDLERYYLEAIEWRSEGLAQGILNNVQALKNYNPHYAQNIQSLLEKLSVRCGQLYGLNKEKNVTHFAVINESGVIAAHNDKELLNTQVSPLLNSRIRLHEQQIVLDNGIYHTLVPIVEDQDTYLGTIDIGVPQKIVDEKVHQLLLNAAELLGVFLILAICMVSLLMHIIVTRPIRQLVLIGKKIAQGELGNTGERDEVMALLKNIKTRDEIGEITTVFQDMITYLHNMADVAIRISTGDLRQETVPRSERDVLGMAFQYMTAYLNQMGQIASYISQGDLRSQITLRSQADQIGSFFTRMQEGLVALISKIRSTSDYIASISIKVLDISTKNSEALGQIGNTAEVTSHAVRQVSTNVEEVRMNTEHLTSAVEETSSSISQMITSIKHIAQNSRNLSKFADDTTATVIDIVNSLENIAVQAEHSKTLAETTTQDAISGQDSVEEVVASIITISEVTENISHIVLRLQNRSLEIGTILDVINDVAEQTSLLALNASIIAAQAGGHGRGFAVVADEIKGLATRVGTSTKEIAKIVEAVQRDSSDAVKAIEHGQNEVKNSVAVAYRAGEALHKIAQSAENSSEVAAEIATLVRQQTTIHTRIAESIRDVSNMINEITRATQEQEEKSSQLFIVIENMQKIEEQVSRVLKTAKEQRQNTSTVTKLMEDVSSLVDENTKAVHELAEVANELTLQADILKQQVKQFTIPLKTPQNFKNTG